MKKIGSGSQNHTAARIAEIGLRLRLEIECFSAESTQETVLVCLGWPRNVILHRNRSVHQVHQEMHQLEQDQQEQEQLGQEQQEF